MYKNCVDDRKNGRDYFLLLTVENNYICHILTDLKGAFPCRQPMYLYCLPLLFRVDV